MVELELGVARCSYPDKEVGGVTPVKCDLRIQLPMPCPSKKIARDGIKVPAGSFIPQVKKDGKNCLLTGFTIEVTLKRDIAKLLDDVTSGIRKLGITGI